MRNTLLFIPVTFLLVSCEPDFENDNTCEPGQQKSCYCFGLIGTTTCVQQEERWGWGTCECCPPDCGDRVCGPDPECPRSCGECDPGHLCTEDGQCQKLVSEIWAHFIIEHLPDDSIVALAALKGGNQHGADIVIGGEDRIECNGAKMVEYLDVTNNEQWYRQELGRDPNDSYDVQLTWGMVTTTTTIVVPEKPTITYPEPGVVVHPGTELQLEWVVDTPAEHVNILVVGPCILAIDEQNVDDDGWNKFLFGLEDSDPGNPTSCSISVSITRVGVEAVGTEFDGGFTEAKRTDSIGLNYEQL